MTAKILKENGQVIYLLSDRALNNFKSTDSSHIKRREQFDESIKEQLGPPMTNKDLDVIHPDAVMPTFPLYEDDFEGMYDHIPTEEDVTPEYQDTYIGAEVNVPIMGDMKSGEVIC